MNYRFTINVEPMGAPRMTQRDKWAQRPVVMKYRDYKDEIRKAAGTLPAAKDILSLSWVAYFEPPVSWSKKRRAAAIGELHRSKPDRDNIDKGILDAMFEDDAGIASGMIEKRWGETARIEVVIEAG